MNDSSSMEPIWTAPETGMMRAYALGEGKILLGVAQPAQTEASLSTYIMNDDGTDAQRLEPMCGLAYRGIMRPAICNGRVY